MAQPEEGLEGLELPDARESLELKAVDIAHLETQIGLLMDLTAERSTTDIDVVGHVSRECLALQQRLAFTLNKSSAADDPDAVADLVTLHARATSALEAAGVDLRGIASSDRGSAAVEADPRGCDDACARAFLRDVEAMRSEPDGVERRAAAKRVDAALVGDGAAALAAAATRVGALGALGAALEAAVDRGETAVAVSAARAAAAVVPALAEPGALLRHAAPTLRALRVVLEHRRGGDDAHAVAVAVAHLSVLLQQGWATHEDAPDPARSSRVLELLVAATCDAARACARDASVDGDTEAVTAFAVANLSALRGARVELARAGALEVLATWLAKRPLSELHRHAAAAVRRLSGAGDESDLALHPDGGDVFARGWLDAKLTDANSGLLAALAPLSRAPVAAIRGHVAAALSELVRRPPNRAAVVEARGVGALLDVLHRCAADLLAPPRRVEAADLAERAIQALCSLAPEQLPHGREDSTGSQSSLDAAPISLRSDDRPRSVAADLVDRRALPSIVAALAHASPRSPLRLAAARCLALLSEEDAGCGNKRCAMFFEAAATVGEDGPETTTSERDVVLAPVDALLLLGGSLDHSDDGGHARRYSSDGSNFEAFEQRSLRRADAREAAHACYALANLAARPELASRLAWERGALPVLLHLHRSRRKPLQARAMRALASLALPLVSYPARDANYGDAVLDEGAAAAAALAVVRAVLATLRDDEGERADADARELTYEAVRCVKNLAFAAPLRTPLIGGALKRLLGVAMHGAHEPRLRALAEATLVALGLDGGARDLELCGNDARLLEEFVEMRASLDLQVQLSADFSRARRDAWPSIERAAAADDDDGGAAGDDAVARRSEEGEDTTDIVAAFRARALSPGTPLDLLKGKVKEVLLNPHLAALNQLKAGGLFLRCASADDDAIVAADDDWQTDVLVVASPLAPTRPVARSASRSASTPTTPHKSARDDDDGVEDAAARLPRWWSSERRAWPPLTAAAEPAPEEADDAEGATPDGSSSSPRRSTQLVARQASYVDPARRTPAFRAANRGEPPPELARHLAKHFPSQLQRRRVAPLHRPPRGPFPWAVGPCAWPKTLVLPARRYFSFRREARVISKLMDHDACSAGRGSYGVLFRDSRFAGEFSESLGGFLARQPRVQSICFSSTASPDAAGDDEGPASLFGGAAGAPATTGLAYLVGSLPASVEAVTLDRALGRDGLQILGILLRTAEERRRMAAKDWDRDEASVGVSGGPALGFLAVRNHDHLGPDDFASLGLYVSTCVASPWTSSSPGPARLRSLAYLDLSGNKLGDAAAATFLRALDRDDASVTALDLSGNALGAFAKASLDQLVREDAARVATPTEVAPPEPPRRGCLFRGRLRYLSLANNGLGPRAAARLLRGLVADCAPGASLRGLNLRGSSFGPPCAIGALAALGAALKLLAANPGRLEELDLDACRLPGDCAKDLIAGLVEGRARSQQDAAHRAALEDEDHESDGDALALDDESDAHESESDGDATDGEHREPPSTPPGAAARPRPRRSALAFVRVAVGNSVAPEDAVVIGDELRRARARRIARAAAARDARRARAAAAAEEPLEPPPPPPPRVDAAAVVEQPPSPKTPEVFGERRYASWPAGRDGTPPRNREADRPPPVFACLFAAPLAWQDASGDLHGIEALDADAERNAISTALEDRRSCRDAKDRVDLSFEAATTDALQSAITRGCAALHYSGHGHPQCLTFEDGRGGLQPVPPSQLRSLVARRPPKLAVVSACHSRRAADALVEAGCAHVVAVSLDAPLLDAAAVAFTRAFYLALAVGDTVAAAFSVGVEAVAASPRVAGAASDAGKGDKFELLPLGGDHDEAVFPLGRGRGWRIARRGDAAPPAPWPPRRTLPATAPRPPDDFLGREVDAFKVLDAQVPV